MKRMSCVAFGLLLGLAGPAAAQEVPSAEEPRKVIVKDAESPEALINVGGFSDDYRIGPGDKLEIQVIGHEELRETVTTSNSGEINVSMLGLIRVLDMTTFEIEDLLVKRFREAGLVVSPEVLVSVEDYQAKPVYVMGSVTSPGEYIMSQALTVADAILMAGGLRFNAGDEALLYRRPEGSSLSPSYLAANPGIERPGVELVRLDITPLKEGRFDQASVSLRRGDVLVVESQILEQFFVVGDVIDPRNFMYTPGKPLMASQAISWAGGPNPTAKMSDGILVRYDVDGNRTEVKVDWGAIIRGKEPDFAVQPNDILFVPGSAIKTITHGLLLLTGNMVQSAAFRIGRTYQLPDAPDRPTQPPSR